MFWRFNSTMKFVFASILCMFICCGALVTKAQNGYDFSQLDLGVAGSANMVKGDVVTPATTKAVHLNFTYNPTSPFLNIVIEAQFGQLAGGDSVKDHLGRQFKSNFNAYSIRAQLQAGEFIDYSKSQVGNFFKNLYISAGVGLLADNITSINRYSLQVPGFYTGGLNTGSEWYIPLKVGYEFKLFDSYTRPSIMIDVGYQYNYMLSDNLDGFVAGKNNDVFTQIVVGIKFAIGPITSYTKQINY